jgi:hypothetical protein
MLFYGILDLCRIFFWIVVDLFRSRAALEAEVLVLKQQIVVLRRGKPNRMPFRAVDRFVLGCACHLFPKARDALVIIRPDTVVSLGKDAPVRRLIQRAGRIETRPVLGGLHHQHVRI